MAIIPCPECKQSVSDRAATCPHCGFAIASGGPAAATPATGGAPMAWSSSPTGAEEVTWESSASPRLLIREAPSAFWAVVVPPLALWLLPRALELAGGLLSNVPVDQHPGSNAGRPHHDLRADEHQGSTVGKPHHGLQLDEQQTSNIQIAVIVIVVLFSLSRILRIALAYARLRGTRYRLTNQRLTVESGLFSKRVDDIDLRTIEDVALEQSALERLLGIGRLVIVSADRSRPRVVLYGIRDPRDVRERLRASAYQLSQRQIFTRAT